MGIGLSDGFGIFEIYVSMLYVTSRFHKQSLSDPYFLGLEVDTDFRCLHGNVLERKVAFDMATLGGSFLGCPRKNSVAITMLCIRGRWHLTWVLLLGNFSAALARAPNDAHLYYGWTNPGIQMQTSCRGKRLSY